MIKKNEIAKFVFICLILNSASAVFAQSPQDNLINKWLTQNDLGKWGVCSATSIEIRAATAGGASDAMTKKLNLMDTTMRMARAKFEARGVPNASMEKVQQAAFNANKLRDAQAKSVLFNNCLDSLDAAAR